MQSANKKINVYTYTRVSTIMQIDGYSLDAQLNSLRKYADYKDYTIVREYSDQGFSGKNTQNRPQFMQMMSDIQKNTDHVKYVLVFKLSRFGRNAADILYYLQFMQDCDVNLICVEDGLDSSQSAGKLMISILSSVAEIERENIRAQTMAGRLQKAREGKWNGGFAPYGYDLNNGFLEINEEEANAIRIIFDKYVHTTLGVDGVAKWLNEHGIKKRPRQNGHLTKFGTRYVAQIIDNPVYAGKIAYGRHKTEKISGKHNEYHVVKKKDYPVYDGIHEAIVTPELWEKAHEKRLEHAHRPEKKVKEHEYILSGLLKCPGCGASMYGIHSQKRKPDGTYYPPSYGYTCRNQTRQSGYTCTWKHHQINAKTIDSSVQDTIISLVDNAQFAQVLKDLIGTSVDSDELQVALTAAEKELRQAKQTQYQLENQLDSLDVEDTHYNLRYESLNRRLENVFIRIDGANLRIQEVQTRINHVQQRQLSRDSVYEYLLQFRKVYDLMTDFEKKTFMKSFISRIELFSEKQKDGRWVKSIHFHFPVYYHEHLTKEIFPPLKTTDETVCLLSRKDK